MASLANLIRSRHPGAYDDLSDEDLISRTLRKYPQYADLASAEERGQAAADIGEARALEGARERAESGPASAPGRQPIGVKGAAAAGMSSEPPEITGQEMAEYGAFGAGLMTGPIAGAASPWLAASPKVLGAAAGAIPGIIRGQPREAAAGAVAGAGVPGAAALIGRTGVGTALARFLTERLGRAAAPAASRVAQEAAEDAALVLPTQLNQEQLAIVAKLKGVAEQSPTNRLAVKKLLPEIFGEQAKDVWDLIMTPRTRI